MRLVRLAPAANKYSVLAHQLPMRVCDPYRWAPAICCGVNCMVDDVRETGCLVPLLVLVSQ